MNAKIVGVIGAMESEIRYLQGKMQNLQTERFASLTFYSGKMGNNTMVLVQSGIGKVHAARCAQALIDRYHPDALLNTGVAGGVGAGLHVGDFVVGTELVQHDFDLCGLGYAKGSIPGCGAKETASVFPSDSKLIEAFTSSALLLLAKEQIHRGRIASGDIFVSDRATKNRIQTDFSALAVEMEGAAIAQVAAENGVPFIVIRAISDLADQAAEESYETFVERTADLSARIVEHCVSNL